MSLPPLSRASVSCPSSARTSSFESRPVRPQGPSDVQGSRQEPGAALRRMLATDGFDSPLDTKKAGSVAAVDDALTQLARVLSQALRVLGGEGAPSEAGVPSSGAAPLASAPRAAPPAQGAPVAESQAISSPGNAPKVGNTMTFQNDGTKPMTVQFTPNAGEKPVDSLTLAPGEKRTVSFPQGWSGNFRSNAGDGAAATLGEVKFNGGANQTYYDVSYIEGHNASMTIQPEKGGRKSGTLDNFVASAPDSVKARDASGAVYGLKKTTTANVQDAQVVDYFRKQVGEAQGYVIPTDDASTLGTSDSHLDVHLKNVV
ncbi:thaumatin family protein [Pyxidicoccus caerfyrddinensis]|uniref:thaumatin family protein n=1 Tax=Pyxidicoccus caerfyrddinensis TaxID=2709663 RepID=UPI0013DC4473|nr:thaumatin family protein [Pyxidicoccus caerfyrddinensis]